MVFKVDPTQSRLDTFVDASFPTHHVGRFGSGMTVRFCGANVF